jgi:hypothetical protein
MKKVVVFLGILGACLAVSACASKNAPEPLAPQTDEAPAPAPLGYKGEG